MPDLARDTADHRRRIERGNRVARVALSLVVIGIGVALLFQPAIDGLIGAWYQHGLAVAADRETSRYSVAVSNAYNIIHTEMDALVSFEVGALPTTVDGTVIGLDIPARVRHPTMDGAGDLNERPPGEDANDESGVFEGGTIRIPLISLNQAIVEGVGRADLRFGPGHYPGTALPGQQGNVVISGHRTTYTRPFRDLDLLSPGDPIWLDTPHGSFKYVVEETLIVDPSNVEPLAGSDRPKLTLTTCHPKGSARQRLVVVAALASDQPLVSRR